MKDLKYLCAFSIPIVAVLGIYYKGFLVFAVPLYAFVLLPLLEVILPLDVSNLTSEEADNKKHKKIFDWLLYFNLPIVYGLIVFALYDATSNSITSVESLGIILSLGIVLGVSIFNKEVRALNSEVMRLVTFQ